MTETEKNNRWKLRLKISTVFCKEVRISIVSFTSALRISWGGLLGTPVFFVDLLGLDIVVPSEVEQVFCIMRVTGSHQKSSLSALAGLFSKIIHKMTTVYIIETHKNIALFKCIVVIYSGCKIECGSFERRIVQYFWEARSCL